VAIGDVATKGNALKIGGKFFLTDNPEHANAIFAAERLRIAGKIYR
jgi:hypothetical protein